MAGALSNRYLLLGLLDRQSMSGYDIRSLLSRFSWLIGSPSYGGLYPALHRLVDDGLAVVKTIASDNGPTRKLYTITQKGRATLQAWLAEPAPVDISLRDFMMLLILAGNQSYDRLISELERRHTQVTAQCAALSACEGGVSSAADSRGQLAREYSLAIAHAELEWLETTWRQMEQAMDVTNMAKDRR